MISDNSSAKTPGYEIQGVYGGGDTQCGLTSYSIILSLECGHQCFRGTHQFHQEKSSKTTSINTMIQICYLITCLWI
jgi:hypothetical protein